EHNEPGLYDKLAAAGLVATREIAEALSVASFCDRYIAGRSADVKWSTAILYRNVRRNLVDYFGANRLLDSITPAEAEDWRRWLARPENKNNPKAGGEGLSRETVRQRCRIGRQFFRDAVRRKLIAESPFAEMKGVSSRGTSGRSYTGSFGRPGLSRGPNHLWHSVARGERNLRSNSRRTSSTPGLGTVNGLQSVITCK